LRGFLLGVYAIVNRAEQPPWAMPASAYPFCGACWEAIAHLFGRYRHFFTQADLTGRPITDMLMD